MTRARAIVVANIVLLGVIAVLGTSFDWGRSPSAETSSPTTSTAGDELHTQLGDLSIADQDGGDDEAPFSLAVRPDASTPTDATPALTVPGLPASVPIGEHLVAHSLEGVRSMEIRVGPDQHTPVGWRLPVPDEFGQERALLVLEERGAWLRVAVPARPNESDGWVRRDDVRLAAVDHRILIDLSERSVVVWEKDEVVLDTTGAIGRASAPTPTGSFYVRSLFPWNPDSVYGPWVIPLSAYSETIDEINGGEAVIAIHGTQRNDLLGEDVSLGCIRLDNDVITQLAAVVPPGTPVEIVP